VHLVPASLLVDRAASLLSVHSFPTRRSSDLERDRDLEIAAGQEPEIAFRGQRGVGRRGQVLGIDRRGAADGRRRLAEPHAPNLRSEEHTSELQSRSDLVCRLLLEKKKKNINT